jgi:hypothetical protein
MPAVSVAGAPTADVAHAPAISVADAGTGIGVEASPAPCGEARDVFLFVSPAAPSVGQPLRVLAISDLPLDGELRLGGSGATVSRTRHGGPPYFWSVEIGAPPLGATSATFEQPACVGHTPATLRIDVARQRSSTLAAPKSGAWPARRAWNHAFENLYSTWIETLFDAPEGELPTWAALHEVLRDPKRNALFDHLGAAEDSGRSAPFLRPDCADLPYFLRAYFAWKLRLPFGLAECSRGGHGAPPACRGLITNEDDDEAVDAKPKREAGPIALFGAFVGGTVANKAHSGSARAPFEDEAADYYPVKLSWDSLRPGTIYADPYGHVLVVAKRVAQAAAPARGGVLYAVDGQPDGTVSRKRFWRGNFLYAKDRALGGPGFKHFRPIVRQEGRLVRLDDEAIRRSPEYGDVSREVAAFDVDGFYDAMDDVLSPRPLDPERAMMETIDALEEQVRTRVQSLDNGRKWLEKTRSAAPMPDGPEIFETTGAWEDFATPSRDLRLLIAIDVVRDFPSRFARHPQRYALPPGKTPVELAADLSRLLSRELDARSVTYTRTDGSPFTLRLSDVLARRASFEMTYNLNDCVEVRWGGAAGTPEASTCRAHAPADQVARMESYRAWFHERRRPPRR